MMHDVSRSSKSKMAASYHYYNFIYSLDVTILAFPLKVIGGIAFLIVLLDCWTPKHLFSRCNFVVIVMSTRQDANI